VDIKLDQPVDIYFVPDTQQKMGVKNPLSCVAYDIISLFPQFVVFAGDHWDMPSLCLYDLGKHSFEEEDYEQDIIAGNESLRIFWSIIQLGFNRNPDWKPTFVFCWGNHEDRINRARETTPRRFLKIFDIVRPDLKNFDHVIPFLEIIRINGVMFTHYLANKHKSTAISNSRLAIGRKHESFCVGHQQGFDYHEDVARGKRIQGIIAGSCYFHNDDYRGPQNTVQFRGTVFLRNVFNGEFDFETRSLSSLEKKYG